MEFASRVAAECLMGIYDLKKLPSLSITKVQPKT